MRSQNPGKHLMSVIKKPTMQLEQSKSSKDWRTGIRVLYSEQKTIRLLKTFQLVQSICHEDLRLICTWLQLHQ